MEGERGVALFVEAFVEQDVGAAEEHCVALPRGVGEAQQGGQAGAGVALVGVGAGAGVADAAGVGGAGAAGGGQVAAGVEGGVAAGGGVRGDPGASVPTDQPPAATRTVRPPEPVVAECSSLCWRSVSRSGTATRSVVSGPVAARASARVVTRRVVTPRSARSAVTARLPRGSAERGSSSPCRASERTVATVTAPARSTSRARAMPRERVHSCRAVGETDVDGSVASVVIGRSPRAWGGPWGRCCCG